MAWNPQIKVPRRINQTKHDTFNVSHKMGYDSTAPAA